MSTMMAAPSFMISETKEGAGVLIRTLVSVAKPEGWQSEQPTASLVQPVEGDDCFIHYECILESGELIDSTRTRNQPLEFRLGSRHVIRGLEVAVQRMHLGQVAEATIPYPYAYGERGHPPEIPERATLIFKRLELVRINDVRPQSTAT